MEPEPVRKERRGRKRKRKDVQNGSVEGQVSKKQLHENNLEPELIALVGRYVKKSFEDSGVFLGKVVYYESGLYRIDYEDGDCEDLESSEIRRILMKNEDFDSKFNSKRKKLDAKVSKKYAKGKDALQRKDNQSNVADKVEASSFSGANGVGSVKFQNDNDDHSDTSSDSCETSCDRNMTSEAESPVVPPPNLPPSSGNIRVPEEYVSHLFSVYSFLRSFSIGLYLSPFGLDEFVGSLNCSVPNTLLDAIHVAVMRALRRHLEIQSSDQSELASKCLRCMDWSLLDTLTWPVYAVQYLMIMGYTDGHEWKGFCKDALVKDYYNLPASRKLTVLQILCDEALDSAELRADIEMRVESELGTDTDGVEISVPVPGPRRVHPRYSKTSACKDQETVNTMEKSEVKKSFDSGGDVDNDDGNGDECRLCGMDGTLLCCDGCPSAYHLRCIGVSKVSIPDGSWFCPECSINKMGPTISDGTSLRGAQVFGIDPYEHVFLGSCNHLLVLKGSTNCGQCVRYYNQKDISVVLQSLCTSVEHISIYSDICIGISKYWEIPESFLTSLSKTVEIDAESSIKNAALEVLKPSTTQNSSYRVYSKDSTFLYTGSSFKTQAYFNNYTHGDFAATASANFAIVSSEENRVTETLAPNSHHAKKLMSASILLQVKAFSSAANRFFWPNFEKKHVEVPRERCGWCLSCKASNNKRGCLLNSAASNAIKGSIKILSGLRPIKNCDESLPSIATYVMFMEECLCGLTFGPFLSLEFRKQWRKQVEQASTCTDVKTLLLQLEQHIHTIALSGEWVKLVDNWSAEVSANQSVTSVIGSTQKRGPGRKRGRKKANAVPDNAAAEDSQDVPTGFAWWRGGLLSKHILQKGTLPLSLLKKMARQSGSKKTPGIFYSEALEIPRRTRQMVWRATVEMSKTASQLAVQVRYLDHHIRWSDLVRPDQTFEGKGAEVEAASAFRNAFICDKRMGEKKTTYGLFFKNQKHLPTRVMKNVLEVEQCESGEEKYWFSETYIPLYLVKEYEEEKVKKGISSMSAVSTELNAKPASVLSKLQKKQLKLSRKNVFLYLSKKKDNLHTCFCAACQLDVLIRNVVKCGECQGYCHEQCTISTPIGMNGMNAEVEYSIICKECRKPKIKPISQTEINNKDSPTSPLFIQHQEIHSAPTVVKKRKHIGSNNNNHSPLPILPVAGNIQRCSSEMKPDPTTMNDSGLVVNRSKIKSWGLIWKKKEDESGIDFRIKNLMLKNNPNRVLNPPECFICHKKYDPSLMYLRCDSCDKWYHAEALELEESKIYDLVGFKCCKCRRIRSPLCPYMTAHDRLMMLNSKKSQKRTSKKSTSLTVVPTPSQQPEQKTWVIDSGAGSAKLPVTKFRIKSNRDSSVQENNHNLFSHSGIEQVTELKVDSEVELNNNSSQKLPVRRQPHILESSSGNFLDEPNTKDESLNLDWDNNVAPTNGFDDNLMFDYENFSLEDMEFEPQTYFSFTELLANDENGQVDGVDQSTEDVMATWDNNIISNTNDSDKVGPPIVPCSFCSKVDPCPDLSCQICGSWVHSQCSPLDVDESFWEGGWRCINCREWR